MPGILEGIEPKGDSFEEGAPFKKKIIPFDTWTGAVFPLI